MSWLVSLAARFDSHQKRIARDLGLLLLRLSVGAMMAFGHGWGKLISFPEKSATFPDPLGVGSSVSMALALGAEFFCSLAVALGLFTRLTALPVVITMLVAALIIHADDPWQKKEFALLYLVPFFCLVLTGPGRFSLDEKIFKNKD